MYLGEDTRSYRIPPRCSRDSASGVRSRSLELPVPETTPTGTAPHRKIARHCVVCGIELGMRKRKKCTKTEDFGLLSAFGVKGSNVTARKTSELQRAWMGIESSRQAVMQQLCNGLAYTGLRESSWHPPILPISIETLSPSKIRKARILYPLGLSAAVSLFHALHSGLHPFV